MWNEWQDKFPELKQLWKAYVRKEKPEDPESILWFAHEVIYRNGNYTFDDWLRVQEERNKDIARVLWEINIPPFRVAWENAMQIVELYKELKGLNYDE